MCLLPAAYIGVKGCLMCPSRSSRDASLSGRWPRGPRPLPHSPSPCCRSVLFQPGSHLANSLILLVAPSLGLGCGTPPLPFLSSFENSPPRPFLAPAEGGVRSKGAVREGQGGDDARRAPAEPCGGLVFSCCLRYSTGCWLLERNQSKSLGQSGSWQETKADSAVLSRS